MTVRLIIGVVVGGLFGYGVYHFIGCSSGACPITSNPWLSIIFGMTFGALVSGQLPMQRKSPDQVEHEAPDDQRQP